MKLHAVNQTDLTPSFKKVLIQHSAISCSADNVFLEIFVNGISNREILLPNLVFIHQMYHNIRIANAVGNRPSISVKWLFQSKNLNEFQCLRNISSIPF